MSTQSIRSALQKWTWLCLVGLSLTVGAAAPSPWRRIVVVGASASAGFILAEPFGGTNTLKCQLRFYLDASLTAPHDPVRNLSSALLFLNPEPMAQQQLQGALDANPSLVVGVDFLFWFCYGDDPTEQARQERFDRGLKLLEQFRCPVVVGDIPDASEATNSGIISSTQVPAGDTLAKVNRRLRDWAATHPQVILVPLSEFMRAVVANRGITVHGQKVPAGESNQLLQPDRLHPTPEGAALLALKILDALVAQHPEFPAKDVRWDRQEVLRRGYFAAQPPRSWSP